MGGGWLGRGNTVNMKERQNAQNAILVPDQLALLGNGTLHHVRDHVAVREHDALRQAGCSGGVDEEREVFFGVLDRGTVRCDVVCVFDSRP